MLQQSSDLYKKPLDLNRHSNKAYDLINTTAITNNSNTITNCPQNAWESSNSSHSNASFKPHFAPFSQACAPSSPSFWHQEAHRNFFYVWLPNWQELCQSLVIRHEEKEGDISPWGGQVPLKKTGQLAVDATNSNALCPSDGCNPVSVLDFSDPYTKYTIESPSWLPQGWVTELQMRRTGATAGTRDKYYKDLVSGRRFRSRTEVFHFLQTGKGRVRRRRCPRTITCAETTCTAIQPYWNHGHPIQAQYVVDSTPFLPTCPTTFLEKTSSDKNGNNVGYAYLERPTLPPVTHKPPKSLNSPCNSFSAAVHHHHRPAQDKLPVKKKVRFESPKLGEDQQCRCLDRQVSKQGQIKSQEMNKLQPNVVQFQNRVQRAFDVPMTTKYSQNMRAAQMPDHSSRKAQTRARPATREIPAAERRIILGRELQEAQQSVVNLGREMQATIIKLGRELQEAQRSTRQFNDAKSRSTTEIRTGQKITKMGDFPVRTAEWGVQQSQQAQQDEVFGNKDMQGPEMTANVNSDNGAARIFAPIQGGVNLGVILHSSQLSYEMQVTQGTQVSSIDKEVKQRVANRGTQDTSNVIEADQGQNGVQLRGGMQVAQREKDMSNDEEADQTMIRLGTQIQSAQTIMRLENVVPSSGENSRVVQTLDRQQRVYATTQRRETLFSVLNPILDMSALKTGLTSRQRARAVQRMKEQHAKQMLVVLGRKLCCKAVCESHFRKSSRKFSA